MARFLYNEPREANALLQAYKSGSNPGTKADLVQIQVTGACQLAGRPRGSYTPY